MQIIDGKLVAKSIRDELKAEITEAYEKYGKIFKLTVIIAGNNPASEIYVRNKGTRKYISGRNRKGNFGKS